ncbi:MAG TPA: hypothetical protein VL002_01345, partial [Candidimonas sp.]|nr:hypothetical protein [Candidimonas sp.]
MMFDFYRHVFPLTLSLSNSQVSSRSEADNADAHQAIGQQTARGSRLLLWVSLLALIALIVWAALGSIDEVVRGEGKVVPSR